MTKHQPYTPVDPTEAQSLNSWPPGCRGWYHENEAIRTLIKLCDRHGYGRIPQLASQIESMSRGRSGRVEQGDKPQPSAGDNAPKPDITQLADRARSSGDRAELLPYLRARRQS